MINAVIFDLDDTLYGYGSAHETAFSALCAYVEREFALSAPEFHRLHREADAILRARAGNGAAIHNRLIRYQIFTERQNAPLRHAMVMNRLYWETLLDHMEITPGVMECFDTLHHTGYTIGIGTNMTADWQYAKLARLDLLDRIDFLVSSEEAGAEKPDPKLFLLCAEKAGVSPENCAYVGDNLEFDVLGAARAGMRGVWFHPDGGSEEPVAWIGRMADLPQLLHSYD